MPIRRNKSIRLRVTEAEHAAMESRAGAAGYSSISDWIRRLVLGDQAEVDGRVARRLERERDRE